MIESAQARLQRTAHELGLAWCAFNLDPGICEAIEGRFHHHLMEGIRQKAEECRWGAATVVILLKRMPAEHDDVAWLIEVIDDDDGWPECPVLHAIKGLHCALSFREKEARWLAEAALQIGELHAGDGPNGFRGHAKAWAGARLSAAVKEIVAA